MRFFNEEFTWILDLKNCNLFHTFIDSAPLKKISSYRNKNILTEVLLRSLKIKRALSELQIS